MGISFELPIKVVSEANSTDHWRVKAKRKKNHRFMARVKCSSVITRKSNCCFNVTLTRVNGPRQRDFDGDNLQSAFKAIRDGIADALGIDDGSECLTWEYQQIKGDRAGVRIEIEEMK